MAPLVPTELLLSLSQSCPCREIQLHQLTTLFNPIYPAPPALVAYGPAATAKSKAIQGVLCARAFPHAFVKSTDSLSQRHFLAKCFAACAAALGKTELLEQYNRADSVNALIVGLQKLLRGEEGQKFVLVLEGIDGQRGANPALLSALTRLPDDVPNLSVVFICTSARPLYLQKAGVPHIYFPPYSRAEAITLVTRSPPALHPVGASLQSTDLHKLRLWYAQFATTVYDSLIAPTTSSVPVFRSTCEKLWPRFIWPYISEQKPPGKAKSWDFTRLLLRNRSLFQSDGEDVLVDRLQPLCVPSTFEELARAAVAAPHQQADGDVGNQPEVSTSKSLSKTSVTTPPQPRPPLLRFFSTLILVSSYLASHTHPKVDLLLFSRLSLGSKSHKIRKSYHKRKLFQSPSKGAAAESASAKTPTRSGLDLRAGVARPFGLERLIAILRAIHPQGVPNKRSVSDKVYRHLAELERLRLVVPAGGASAGRLMGGYDEDEKWRINVSREWVEDMASKWNFGFGEYEMGGA